jgi:hypothetical protein
LLSVAPAPLPRAIQTPSSGRDSALDNGLRGAGLVQGQIHKPVVSDTTSTGQFVIQVKTNNAGKTAVLQLTA